MTDILGGQKRTVYCGNVDKSFVGQQISIMGWVHRRRDLGSLIFLQVRDRTGLLQVTFDDNVAQDVQEKASQLKLEYVVAVTGTVRLRTEGNVNPDMKTGEVELVGEQLKILSVADTPPFSIGDEKAGEMLRLKYRYLDLRRESLQQNLITRSKICHIVRNYFDENDFVEVETPFLGKSTPEGARDYLVPSRVHPGDFYALPQSPQMYKQLLMIGGMDRYYQIVKCFRDEDLRANRQPEFTQIDLEMSFVDNEEDVMAIAEGMVKKVFSEIKGIDLGDFPKMTYSVAMEKYGSDKPDLRFGMEIQEIGNVMKDCGFVVFDNCLAQGGFVKGIVLKGHASDLSRKDLDKLVEFVKTYKAKGLAWYGLTNDGVKSSFAKNLSQEYQDKLVAHLGLQVGDIALIVADGNYETTVVSLGALRCELASKFNLIPKDIYAVTWIVDFPLFEYSEEESRWTAKHHPFTSPKHEDLPYIKSEPGRCRAKAYDLVINGDEMGGGSMRIYNRDVQKLMFEAIGLSEEQINDRFGFFVNAFNYGTPPHGGLAFGLDRLVMVLCGTDNIKETIAFPKIQNASCLMCGAPADVDQKQLDDLAIGIVKND